MKIEEIIPIPLFFEIQSFLSSNDYIKWMRCSKKMHEIGNQTTPIRLHINKKEDISRKLQQLKGIKNSCMRLSLLFLGLPVNEEFLMLINEIKPKVANLSLFNTIDFQRMKGFACNHFNVTLSAEVLPNVFLNLRSLNLHNCRVIEDLHCLQGLHELSLSDCDVTDLSPVQNIFRLILSHCNKVKDISFLRNNHIKITHCLKITNFLTLKHSIVLNLHSKHLVRFNFDLMDLTEFENARSLTISQVPGDTVAIPTKMQKLSLSNCEELQNIHLLGNLTELTLYYCHSIQNLNGLGKIRRLTLSRCSSLQDISAISSITQYVEIYRCHRISDFQPLQHIPRVIIRDCRQFQLASHVSSVKHLTIEKCHNFSRVKLLANIQHLEIRECNNITSLHGLGNIPILEIRECKNITTLEGLGNNEKLIFDSSSPLDQHPIITEFFIYQPCEGNQKVYLRKVTKDPLPLDTSISEFSWIQPWTWLDHWGIPDFFLEDWEKRYYELN